MDRSPQPAGPEAPGPLAGIRVIEVDDGLAEYCGKILADMGAEVIKIEPPAGARSRRVPPFADGAGDPDGSLAFWSNNTNKRSVVLDLETAEGRDVIRALAARSDVVIDGLGRGRMEGWGLGPDELQSIDPRLICLRVTPFGPDGPWSDLLSSDLVQMALGGTMAMTGYDDLPGFDSHPIGPSGGQTVHVTGAVAAIGVVGALHHREATGVGEALDVAAHDAMTMSNEMGISYWVFEEANVYRHTGRHASSARHTPRWLFRCRDGRYVMCMAQYLADDTRWRALVDWMDSYGLAGDLAGPEFGSGRHRRDRTDHVVDMVDRFCAQLDSTEVFHGAQSRKLPWAPVNEPGDLLADEHVMVDRRAVVTVDHPGVDRPVAYPGPPYRFERTPWAIRRRPPDLGADTSEVLGWVAAGTGPPGPESSKKGM